PESIKAGDLRDVDENIGAVSCLSLGFGYHLFELIGETGDPRAACAQGKPATLCDSLQCRVAIHDSRLLLFVFHFNMKETIPMRVDDSIAHEPAGPAPSNE